MPVFMHESFALRICKSSSTIPPARFEISYTPLVQVIGHGIIGPIKCNIPPAQFPPAQFPPSHAPFVHALCALALHTLAM